MKNKEEIGVISSILSPRDFWDNAPENTNHTAGYPIAVTLKDFKDLLQALRGMSNAYDVGQDAGPTSAITVCRETLKRYGISK